jgi:hypothetical protein
MVWKWSLCSGLLDKLSRDGTKQAENKTLLPIAARELETCCIEKRSWHVGMPCLVRGLVPALRSGSPRDGAGTGRTRASGYHIHSTIQAVGEYIEMKGILNIETCSSNTSFINLVPATTTMHTLRHSTDADSRCSTSHIAHRTWTPIARLGRCIVQKRRDFKQEP